MNINDMRLAAKLFIGEHDFRNFCKMNVIAVSNYKRKIFRFDICKVNGNNEDECSTGHEENGINDTDMYMFEIEGTAFLWHQVRMMTAVLFLVGSGKEDPPIISTLLNVVNHPRRPQYNMSNEGPLVLYKTNYKEVSFNTSEHAMKWLLKRYEDLWHEYAVKACMMREFINVAQKSYNKSISKVAVEEGTTVNKSTSSSTNTKINNKLLVVDDDDDDENHFISTKKPIKSRLSDYISGHESSGEYISLLNRTTAMSYEERINNLSEKRLEERNRLIQKSKTIGIAKNGILSERERAIRGRDRV